MKQPRVIWIFLLLATGFCCWLPVQPPTALGIRIKVENEGGIVMGFNTAVNSATSYDAYFISVNELPKIGAPAH